MKMKSLACAAFLGMLTYSAAALASDTSQTQHVYVTNLLVNSSDDFPARTQTPLKIEVHQGNKICYTVWSLSFGDMYKLTASPSDINCLYISELVVTPLPVNKIMVYSPESMRIKIEGKETKYTQVTVIQKFGKNSAPLFNDYGTLDVQGEWSYQLGAGLVS